MSNALRQRGRIARVRHLQHDLAAAAASEALAKLRALEASVVQLTGIRNGLVPDDGQMSGASFAAIGELAARLEQARAGLEQSVQRAREVAEGKEQARLSARIRQESADRLKERAGKLEAERQERASAVPSRAARRLGDGDRE